MIKIEECRLRLKNLPQIWQIRRTCTTWRLETECNGTQHILVFGTTEALARFLRENAAFVVCYDAESGQRMHVNVEDILKEED